MGYVWEDDFIKYHRRTRRSFVLVAMGLAALLGVIISLHQNRNDLQHQIDRISCDLNHEIANRRAVDNIQCASNEGLSDLAADTLRRLDGHDKTFARIDLRLDEFNNACDHYCSQSSADFFKVMTDIHALEEDRDRHEELIRGLFHNFDVVWPWLEGIDQSIIGLAKSMRDHYTKPDPSFQRIRCRRR